MLTNIVKFVLSVALLVICQPQACNTQFWQNPFTGSVSRARSSATGHQLGLGALGISEGVVNAQTETEANGGIANGGTTSIANSRSRTGGVNIGGLGVDSTITHSKSNTNGQVSRGLSHDVNVGGLGLGSSLSRDNLNNGFGVQRSQDGGLKFGLGFLNFDLGRKQQSQAEARTQAQAQAQGENAFATADSNSNTQSRQFGGLGFARTQSESNALSATNYGQTSANAGGFVRNNQNYGQFRKRREAEDTFKLNYDASSRTFVRPRRKATYVPFLYPDSEAERPKHTSRPADHHARPNYDFVFPEEDSANAQGLANSKNYYFEQQAGANSHNNHKENAQGLFQDNGASSIGSNLATDGSSGQLSSANVIQDKSITKDGSHSSNDAQSQALNFDKNQQQAANANAGTKETETKDGKRVEAHGGSQATNNNDQGSSSSIANTNSVTYENSKSRVSQADSSSQSIFQGKNGQNSGAQTNSNVDSEQAPDGSIRNTASSDASAVSHGGQNGNAVASASSSSGFNGGNVFTNANGNAGTFGNYNNFGGAQANSGVFNNFVHKFRAFKLHKRKSFTISSQPRKQQQNQTASTTTLDIINNSAEIKWPKNRIQTYNYHAQHQQKPQPQPHQQQYQRQREQQPQQIYPQQLHYSTINPNSATEQFAVIDENERHGRTITLIADLIKNFMQPSCIYPCTLDAYQQGSCCETPVVSPPQTPPNSCCKQLLPPLPSTPPLAIRPPIPILYPLPPLNFPLLPSQCCNSCPAYGYFGPPPCIPYKTLGRSPERVTLYAD